MIQQDDKELVERFRDLLEYHVSFVPGAGEVVKKVVERRGDGGNKISTSDEQFKELLERKFGRGIDEVFFRPEKK